MEIGSERYTAENDTCGLEDSARVVSSHADLSLVEVFTTVCLTYAAPTPETIPSSVDKGVFAGTHVEYSGS